MPKLDGLKTVLDFLKGLQPKVAAQQHDYTWRGNLAVSHAQIAKKVLSLNIDPLPNDSKQLKGYSNLYRVDSGEYRIVYRFKPKEDLVEVILVGKRNDDDVYKKLSRLVD